MQRIPQTRPRPQLRRPFEHWLTIAISQICIMTLLVVMFTVDETDISPEAAVSKWGGMGSGLEVWQGEWWRIWTTQVHHADLLHLVMNLLLFLFFGRIMEPRLGAWKYALFMLGAAGFAGTLQTLFGPNFVGISGVVFAQWGWIVTERDRDPQLADRFPDSWAYLMVIVLCLGIPMEWTETVPIANACHFGGAIYGVIWGKLSTVVSIPLVRYSIWVASHLLLIPAVNFVTHPTWDADYYWLLGDNAPSISEKIHYYELGLEREPDHKQLSTNLAITYLEHQEPLKAWDTILRAVKANPADLKTLEEAREIGTSPYIQFRLLFDADNPGEILRKYFGEQAPQWEQTLMHRSTLADAIPNRSSEKHSPLHDELGPAIPWKLEALPRNDRLPHPDPNAPGSAEAGVSI